MERYLFLVLVEKMAMAMEVQDMAPVFCMGDYRFLQDDKGR